MTIPHVFLSHASEDKVLARQIATDLQASGVETFFAEWEIRAGDSLRQRIDEGLQECTHFVVLLTPNSISKPWVKAEIDAGFVQKINGKAKFIPLRRGVNASDLPPLLASLLSPSIDDYDVDLKHLIHDIHGFSLKPLLGEPPSMASSSLNGKSGFSVAAENVATLLANRSTNGLANDPHLSVDELRSVTGYTDNQLIEAVDELREANLVALTRALGAYPFGYLAVRPTDLLFRQFDPLLKGWRAEEDAVRVAIEIVNGEERGAQASDLCEKLDWLPRRLNPALAYLIDKSLVTPSKALNATFVTAYVLATPATKRFARALS